MRPPPDSASPSESTAPEPSGRMGKTACGRLAESIAADYLQLRGFRILERNAREGPREIDLIAEQEGWVVIVEVRFRSDTTRGHPEETLHHGKRTHLQRAGRAWWLRHGRERGLLRYDVIAITATADGLTLRHHPHFMLPGR